MRRQTPRGRACRRLRPDGTCRWPFLGFLHARSLLRANPKQLHRCTASPSRRLRRPSPTAPTTSIVTRHSERRTGRSRLRRQRWGGTRSSGRTSRPPKLPARVQRFISAGVYCLARKIRRAGALAAKLAACPEHFPTSSKVRGAPKTSRRRARPCWPVCGPARFRVRAIEAQSAFRRWNHVESITLLMSRQSSSARNPRKLTTRERKNASPPARFSQPLSATTTTIRKCPLRNCSPQTTTFIFGLARQAGTASQVQGPPSA